MQGYSKYLEWGGKVNEFVFPNVYGQFRCCGFAIVRDVGSLPANLAKHT